MDEIKGFNLEAMGGASWDRKNSSASSSGIPALKDKDPETPPPPPEPKHKKQKVPKTAEQIEAKKVATAKKCVENLAKDLKCVLYNNGRKLARGKEDKYKHAQSQIKELEKLAAASENHKELNAKIVEIRNELPN